MSHEIANWVPGANRYDSFRALLEQSVETQLCCVCVTSAGLPQHELSDEQVEPVSALPPFAGDLLVRSLDEVATRPRGQVAWNRCLEVDLRHGRHLVFDSARDGSSSSPMAANVPVPGFTLIA